MNVYCQVVVRNEQARYWRRWLEWTRPIFDWVHVFDDDSTDATSEMAVSAGCHVTRRDGRGKSFLNHEGFYRQQAWREFELRCKPQEDDWVFCIDADEFLVSRHDEAAWLHDQCSLANQQGVGALVVDIPEVFSVDEVEDAGTWLVNPAVRIDGFWGDIRGPRLFRYQTGGVFSHKQMGSGSEPTYVQAVHRTSLDEMWLMHYGYARKEDQLTKYARYSTMGHGHSNQHVESIVGDPSLVPWDGPRIDVLVGAP